MTCSPQVVRSKSRRTSGTVGRIDDVEKMKVSHHCVIQVNLLYHCVIQFNSLYHCVMIQVNSLYHCVIGSSIKDEGIHLC